LSFAPAKRRPHLRDLARKLSAKEESNVTLISLQSPRPEPVRGPPWLALGFRPFFLMAGIGAVGLMAAWLGTWGSGPGFDGYYGPLGWHSHEMLFGYTTAVIAGFLLTAVRNWTGIDTLRGPALGALAGVWLAARLLALLAGEPMPGYVTAAVDLAFLPLLAVALAGPLLRAKHKINLVFLPLLGAMALANLLVHLEALGIARTAGQGNGLMLNAILLLVMIVGGRVIPFFTEKAIPGAVARHFPWLDWLGFGALLSLAAAELLWPRPELIAGLSLLLALTQSLRLAGWHDRRAWSIPILWVLFTGYGWLAVGFLLKGLGAAGLLAPPLALHALTTGGIGVLTLGMMARVALGHTGRHLASAPLMNLAFVLINLAAAARSLGPLLLPQWYVTWVHGAGGLWILAFAIFSLIYAPILLRPRADGRPG
jgi:uncharacterized protein involved in response to NO